MKVRYLKSASVVIEDDHGNSILCDPRIVEGAYYGSWYHYPPLTFAPEDFNHVNYNLAQLNDKHGAPDIEEAKDLLQKRVSDLPSMGLLLESNSYFDLNTEQTSVQYVPQKVADRNTYINSVLALKKMDPDEAEAVPFTELTALLENAYIRMEKKRKEINFTSETLSLISLKDNKCIRISVDGGGYKIISEGATITGPFVKLTLNYKLLSLILRGPRFAHRNNAKIGSHIRYKRKPDTFEQGFYYTLNFFHA